MEDCSIGLLQPGVEVAGVVVAGIVVGTSECVCGVLCLDEREIVFLRVVECMCVCVCVCVRAFEYVYVCVRARPGAARLHLAR